MDCTEFDSGALCKGIFITWRCRGAPLVLMPHPLDRTTQGLSPVPAGPWIMAQSWHDLLFAHWRVDPAVWRATSRPMIPDALEIDTFEGDAWIGVVPFRMSGVRLRATPSLPWLSAFPELNVRTYVIADGKPGVWFFSLDAGNAVAVAAARAWFHLPYFRARMRCEERDGWIHYSSQRTHRGARPAVLRTQYRPVGEVFEPRPETLEHFLTERYCLYAASVQGRIYRGEIQHQPWRLQGCEAVFEENSMTEAAGTALPREKPLLHFARRQDVVVWNPRCVFERRNLHHL
jgi:uncharacterized protein